MNSFTFAASVMIGDRTTSHFGTAELGQFLKRSGTDLVT